MKYLEIAGELVNLDKIETISYNYNTNKVEVYYISGRQQNISSVNLIEDIEDRLRNHSLFIGAV